jgi:putative ABC transport system permease protein
MFSDLKSALRQFAQRPSLNALIIGILALAIGANAAMFTLADAALFRGLAVPEPDRLVRVFVTDEQASPDINNMSFLQREDLAAGVRSFEGVAAYSDWTTVNAAVEGGVPERMAGGLATGNFWQVLGLSPALGRFFTPEEDQVLGGHPVVVISHHFWRTRFDAAPDVLGRSISINRQPYTIIGVAPAGFGGPSAQSFVHLWMPMRMGMQVAPGMVRADTFTSRGFSWLDLVARLAPGVTLEQARAEVDAYSARLAAETAKRGSSQGAGDWHRLLPAEQASIDPYGTDGLRRNAWLLMAVVGILLALACANVAGLLAVRGEERQHELAVRLGLGASRVRVARQLSIECAVLALAGLLGGLVVARLLLLYVGAEAPPGVVLPVDPAAAVIEPRVLLVTMACAVIVVLVAGLAPAWRAAQVEVATTLKGSGTATTGGRAQQAWRGAMVATQVGLSTALLVVAGLLLRAFHATATVDPGFDTRGAITLSVDLARHGVPNERWGQELDRLAASVAALPGVERVAWANNVPVRNGGMRSSIELDTPNAPGEDNWHANVVVTRGDFLGTLGLTLLQGRMLRDTEPQPAVIVNRAMAEKFWPGQDAVGQRIKNLATDKGGVTVVGVVADSKLRTMREAAEPILYVPFDLFSVGTMGLLARVSGDPVAMLVPAQRAIQALEPELTVIRPQTLDERLAASYAEARLFAFLTAGFAGLALVLSAAGLYGLLAHALRARTRELGIRMALGATRERIAALVLGQTFTLVMSGLVVGLAGALLLARLVEEMLFGVPARDPLTFAMVALVVGVVGLLASWLPTRRATSIQPAIALRNE